MASSLFAQITLTQNNSTPLIGESFTLISESTVMNVANTGANQTWDFSGVTGGQQGMSAISLSNSLDPSSFPTATLVESYASNEIYTLASSTEYSQVGVYIPGTARLINSDPREILKFPLTYQSVFNETFLGELTNLASNQAFTRGGTIKIEADGYGDVTLPYTTVSNVLRIKTTVDYSDIFQGSTIASYQEIFYQWFDGNNHTYVAAYNEFYVNGTINTTTAIVLDQSSFVTSVPNVKGGQTNLVTFYPNPAKNAITISHVENIESIAIIDLKGQVVKTFSQLANLQVLNISELNSGIYFIKYLSNNDTFTEKLIVR